MINIFKKKTVYKFDVDYSLDWIARTIKDKSEKWDTSYFDEAIWLFLAKNAKKQFRWAVRSELTGRKRYYYYLDEKHMTYIELSWPHLAERLRELKDA